LRLIVFFERCIFCEKVGDELAAWAVARATSFFIKPDAPMLPALGRVSAWTIGQRYEPAAVNTSLQVADYYLVAYALVHGGGKADMGKAGYDAIYFLILL
jgi:hypothetical protein